MFASTSPYFGLGLGLLVGLALSVQSVFVNLSARYHDFADILLFRMFWSSLFLLPMVWRSIPKAFTRDAVFIWPRSLFGGCSALCFFYCLTHSSIAIATLLANLAPVWVLFLSWAFFSEVLTKAQTIGAFIVIGAVISLNVSDASVVTPLTAFIGSLGAFFAASALVSLRQASQKQNVFLIVFFMSVVTALIALPFCQHPLETLMTWRSVDLWGVVVASIVYQSSMTFQYRFLPAALAIVLNQTTLLWSFVFDITFFNKYPTRLEVLVVVAVVVGISIVKGFPQWMYRQFRWKAKHV